MPNLKESFLQQDFGSLWYPKCRKTGSGTVGGQGRKVFQILFNQTFFFLIGICLEKLSSHLITPFYRDLHLHVISFDK